MSDANLYELGARVRQGDLAAAETMRQTLQPILGRMARRAICHGRGSPLRLTQPILAQVGRLAPDGYPTQPGEQEQLVEQVAESLCESVIDRLQAAPCRMPGIRETVRN